MIEAAVSAFGGGSIVTAMLTIIVKLWDRKLEADERKTMLLVERAKIDRQALDGIARRTNNGWGNSVRFILAVVPQFIMIALLWIGYNNPEVVIWYGQSQEPNTYSFLFGLIEFELQNKITWREFNGVIVIPALFAQMGAVNAYFLVGGMFSRR